MQDFYVVARPSTVDLLRNQFPHNNMLARVTVTTSLAEAMSAAQLNTPEISSFEDALSHLQLPQAMAIYHTQGEWQRPLLTAEPGKPQQTNSSVFDVLKIKSMEILLSDDPLHPAEAQKDKNVHDVMVGINSNLWNRVRHLEEYAQAVNIYTKTPPDAWKTWFRNVAAAENGKAWHVPGSAASYFQMYYELSPFKGDVERSAQFATAKTANYLQRTPVTSGFQPMVLRALEDNAMLATRNLSALYGHQMPPHTYEHEILRHAMQLVQNINPGDREAFVKGVQTTGEIWHGIPAEEIFKEACAGFLRNHPSYGKTLDADIEAVQESMRSPVPMMVYGYAIGFMQQQYNITLDRNSEMVFKHHMDIAQGHSEMQRIGDSLNTVIQERIHSGYELPNPPAGMDIVQKFTHDHLSTGMYTPVCFAWVPDDIRQTVEDTYTVQASHRENLLAMTYALATGMAKCNQTHNSASMMRDISTAMNEVTMQAVKAGLDPRDISALMNEAFGHANDDVSDDFEEHN